MNADLYAVLGVPPSASARDIKRAYFRLMRKVPPETHPEEFSRLRQAYEVLGDPHARSAYDGAARLLPAQGLGHEATDPAQAEADPAQRAAMLLRQGHTCAAAGHHQAALELYGEALDLSHGTGDVRVYAALVDSLLALGRHDDALVTLDHAVYAGAELGPQEVALLLRKVEIRYLQKNETQAEHELDAIVRALPPAPDTRAHVRRLILELAGRMFKEHHVSAGARLLGYAQQLSPRKEGPVPVLLHPLKRPLSALPQDLARWIRGLGRDPLAIHRPYVGWILRWLALALFCAGLVALDLSYYTRVWHGARQLFLGVLLCLGALLALSALARAARAAIGRAGSFTTLVGPYLVRVDLDQVWILPLLTLIGANRRAGPGGSGFFVDAFFTGGRISIWTRLEGEAAALLQALHEAHERCLALISSGRFTDEPTFRLLPADLTAAAAQGEEARAARRGRIRQAAFFGAAVALMGLSLAAGVRQNRLQGEAAERRRAAEDQQREEALWKAATTPHGLWVYGRVYEGRRSDLELRARRQEIYAQAKIAYQKQAPHAPAQKAMLAVLDTTSALLRQEPEMQLVFHPFVDRELAHLRRRDKAAEDGAAEAPLSSRALAERQQELAQALSQALDRVVGWDLLRLTVSTDPEPNLPTLNVRYAVLPAAKAQDEEGGGKEKRAKTGVVVRWKATIDGTPALRAPYTFELTSAPKADRLAFSLGGVAEAAEVDRLLGRAFAEFAARMAEQIAGPVKPGSGP